RTLRLDLQSRHPPLDAAAAATQVQPTEPRISAQSAEREVVGDAQALGQALAFSIFRNQAHTRSQPGAWRGGRREAGDAHSPAADRIEREQAAQQFRATGADQPGDSKNLAA